MASQAKRPPVAGGRLVDRRAVYQWSRQTRSLHEPFQRRSTQRQRWATMVALAVGALMAGVIARSVPVAGPARLNAMATAIAAKIVRKVDPSHPWLALHG